MPRFVSGQVSYLPQHDGDGYGYGGDCIVTFGPIALNLGRPKEWDRLLKEYTAARSPS